MTNDVSESPAGPVARIAMDRPQVHNAFNEHVIEQLRLTFEAAGADPNIRVIVLSGQGPSFSAGADLDWMRRMSEATEAENRDDAERLAKMLRAVAECPKPVVARVQGNAFGGGAGLVACADIAIAETTARFGFTEVRLGLAPATIAPHVIRKIGPGAALPLFLTGERFDADYAHAIGLVHRVVPEDELDDAVNGVVLALLAGSPKAQTAVKDLVRRIAADQSADVDAYTSGIIAALRSGGEGREGVAAFLEKRKPDWAVE